MGLSMNAVVLCSLFIMGLDTSAAGSIRSKNATNFEKAGFVYIGNMRDNGTSSGIQSVGTQSISLFLSPEGHVATQDQAVIQCRHLYGNLLFILNDDQFDDVRFSTNRIGEPFWTSGMYDAAAGGFVWSHFGIPVNSNHIRKESCCEEGGADRGLSVQGVLSTFGLCSAKHDTKLRYICRV